MKLSVPLFCSLLFFACSRDNSLMPDSSDAPSAQVRARVTTQYPQAENLVAKALEKDRVWQVDFTQNTAQYSAAVSTNQFLASFEKGGAAPDSLTFLARNTVVAGGTFSNFSVQRYSWYKNPGNYGQRFLADYDWQGTRHTYRWGVTNINGRITFVTEVIPHTQLEYRTENLADMPAPIQQFVQGERASFDFAEVQVDGQGRKLYTVGIRQNDKPFTLLANNDAAIVGISYHPNPQYFTEIGQLPATIQTYLRDTPELTGFGLAGQFTVLAKNQFGALTTYRVNLQKGRQTWFMLFDANGKLVSRNYLNLVGME